MAGLQFAFNRRRNCLFDRIVVSATGHGEQTCISSRSQSINQGGATRSVPIPEKRGRREGCDANEASDSGVWPQWSQSRQEDMEGSFVADISRCRTHYSGLLSCFRFRCCPAVLPFFFSFSRKLMFARRMRETAVLRRSFRVARCGLGEEGSKEPQQPRHDDGDLLFPDGTPLQTEVTGQCTGRTRHREETCSRFQPFCPCFPNSSWGFRSCPDEGRISSSPFSTSQSPNPHAHSSRTHTHTPLPCGRNPALRQEHDSCTKCASSTPV